MTIGDYFFERKRNFAADVFWCIPYRGDFVFCNRLCDRRSKVDFFFFDLAMKNLFFIKSISNRDTSFVGKEIRYIYGFLIIDLKLKGVILAAGGAVKLTHKIFPSEVFSHVISFPEK